MDDSPTPPVDSPPLPPGVGPEHLPGLLPAYWWFLTSFGWVMLLVQLACVVHVIRSGRPYYWIWIILAFPFIGLGAYLLLEVRPSWGKLNWEAIWWKLKTSQQRIAHRREQLEFAATQKNRFLLAEELAAAGKQNEACEVLAGGLHGAFKDDAETLLRLSQAQLEAGRAAEADATYARIQPDRSSEFQTRYRLLRARLWAALGQRDKAESQFQDSLKSRRSEAPRYFYAEFLLATDRATEGQKILTDILHQYRRGTSVWRYQEREWYYAAKKLLRTSKRPAPAPAAVSPAKKGDEVKRPIGYR